VTYISCQYHGVPEVYSLHRINFKDTEVLARMTGYMKHLVKEAIQSLFSASNKLQGHHSAVRIPGFMDHLIKMDTENQLHPDTFNRSISFPVSLSWYPATNVIKHVRELNNHCKERPVTGSMN
jgi:hypothetical protein